MEKTEVVRKVVEVIGNVQQESGRTLHDITAGTYIYTEIDGFDSLNGFEATVILSEGLGDAELPDDLFLPEKGDRDISVGEIADRVCDKLNVEANVR
ncbi:MAG: hypothetical protein OXH06_16170 [Gemmatimonadetes bacterium]|nr:hypothetical protein [Gemmatimonadota bacterium]